MLRFSYTILFLMLMMGQAVLAQRELIKLPRTINQPSVDTWAPFVSGDGNTIVFISNYSDDGHHVMYWSTRDGVVWQKAKLMNKLVNKPLLNFRGGYSLNFDGTELYITSQKSGLGGFDIWVSKKVGNDWGPLRNLGRPVNSSSHEGSPYLTPDGQVLYFMRCDRMKPYEGASGCKLYYTQMWVGRWKEPVALPDNINTGNSQTPRLLSDGETLIFSSDQMGGKGGLDLFMSKKIGENEWTDPVAMDFANTEKDDAFVSVTAKGRYLYKGVQGDRDHELVQILIPEAFKPARMMRVEGTVVDEKGMPVNAELLVFNVDEEDRLWKEDIGKKGEFAIALKEGAVYDIMIDHPDPGYMHYASILDLNEVGRRDRKTLEITLKPMEVGASYPLEIQFEPYASEISDNSLYAMRRLGDFIRKTPGLKVGIEIVQKHYREDTVQSHPDLTETRTDTIFFEKPMIEQALISPRHDSLFHSMKQQGSTKESFEVDSVAYQLRVTSDSLLVKAVKILPPAPEFDIDSLQQDSVALVQPPPRPDTVTTSYPLKKFKTVTIYHNDRTETQGEAIKAFLINRGVPEIQFEIVGKLEENPLPEKEQPTTEVQMVIKNF